MVRVGRAQSGSVPGSLPREPGCGDDLWGAFPSRAASGFSRLRGRCARVSARVCACPGARAGGSKAGGATS